MKASITKAQIEKLIPVLSSTEKKGIIAYYNTYEKYAADFAERATEDLKKHPVFGKLIRDIPKEVSEAINKKSQALQKDAIFNNNWLPYVEYQIEQGVSYARMGLDFKSWYEVIALVRNYLSPYLVKDYGNGPEFLSALNGMNCFMDIAMGIIGEAYIQEKKEIIIKLNQELEQKVIERTAQLETNIEQLKESEDKFQKAFLSSAAGISITRLADSRYLDVNDAFIQMTGYSKEELIGHSSAELNMIVNVEKRSEMLKQIREQGSAKHSEITARHKSGRLIEVLTSVETILLKGEKYAINILFDITDRKRAEEQLNIVNKELEAFTYSVSHDLRAPLRAINGYAEMLNVDFGTKLDVEGKRIIDIIRNNALKMGTLIDELLSFSRLGRKELQMKEINMNELTKGVLNELTNSTILSAKINLGKLHTVKADYALLEVVMFNLISNALKYSSKRESPLVEIFSEQKKDEIIFSVKDNGAGFNMKYYDKLFEVFQRLHGQNEFEGVGVGLATVQRIIAKHGGKVWAEGKENEGAQFNFSLTLN